MTDPIPDPPAPRSPAPGWYPDPTGATRWWDGAQWTDQVQAAPPRKGVSVPRLIGGIVLLFLVLVNLSGRAQRGETFANGAEASGYLVAMLAFVVAGVWLLVSAFRRR